MWGRSELLQGERGTGVRGVKVASGVAIPFFGRTFQGVSSPPRCPGRNRTTKIEGNSEWGRGIAIREHGVAGHRRGR